MTVLTACLRPFATPPADELLFLPNIGRAPMSHVIAETPFHRSDNVIAAVHVPERHLAEEGAAPLSLHEARASGIATIWLLFYALAALVVVIAN
jgi:hypothetical protein